MNISPVKVWRNQKKISQKLGRVGKILSFTKIFIPPSGFETEAPYSVALALFGKEKIVAQVVDSKDQDLHIGQKVKVVLRRIKQPDREGIIPYGIKFKPL